MVLSEMITTKTWIPGKICLYTYLQIYQLVYTIFWKCSNMCVLYFLTRDIILRYSYVKNTLMSHITFYFILNKYYNNYILMM